MVEFSPDCYAEITKRKGGLFNEKKRISNIINLYHDGIYINWMRKNK